MEYPDDYKAYQTKIIKFDRDYNEEMQYNFYGLFPSKLNAYQLSMKDLIF